MNVDPLAEQAVSWTPYRYGYNNPIIYNDPTGMLESTHINEEGKVIAVFNDGDSGVYQHTNNADKSEVKEYQLSKRAETKGTSSGGIKVGETEYWDEFIVPGTMRAEEKIILDPSKENNIFTISTWNEVITERNKKANNQDLTITMEQSKLNKELDIKNNYFYAPYGPMTGRLLNGKFATARSAGNYLAGLNGVTGTFQGMKISGETYMKLAGAYQQGKLNLTNIAKILFLGKSFGPSPYYGEENYSGRRILQGINHGKKN